MNEASKVQLHHLERGAYLYIRQSSMRQVVENVESTKRQYALRGRATALGWRDEQIIVIDSDQGESGASASWRGGFQRLVTDVGMGHAGIVMGLEVSRLARNNADWHRLLEICALADTLILDEDGVYDPASFNDRLLLGLKGTMSEAELHVIKARLRGGILNKVRRGEYRCALPTGFVHDDPGNVVLDPDSQIRETVAYFFATFTRVGSACQTVKVFRDEGLLFPSRLRNSATTVFRPLTASTAIRTLNNPRYAGAYTYGRRHYRRAADGKKSCESGTATTGSPASRTLIPVTSPGSNSSKTSKSSRATVEGTNLLDRRHRERGWPAAGARGVWTMRQTLRRPIYGAARETGGVVCLRPRAQQSRRTARPVDCRRAHRRGDRRVGRRGDDTHRCRVGTGDPKRDRSAVRRGRSAALSRHRTRSDRSRPRAAPIHAGRSRQPSRRRHARRRMERQAPRPGPEDRRLARQEDQLVLDEAIRNRLIAMTTDFKTLWRDPALPNRERKRLLAYIIEDVTLIKLPAEGTTRIHVRFKGGKTETLTVRNPKSSAQQVKTPPKVIELVDTLLDNYIYPEIADILNERGIRPGGSARRGRSDAPFTALRVAYLAHEYALRSRYDRLRARGMLTREEAASRLGICESTLIRWVEHGLVVRHAYNAHAYLYEASGSNPPVKHCSRWDRLIDRGGNPARDHPKVSHLSRFSIPIGGDAV
jgi:DNA invertase Pin-like site-specific DNA recombinase